MHRITGVTFIVIRRLGEILMQLRDGNSKRYPNMWCFPGGTVEWGEDEIQTVVREIKEEYDLDISNANCRELMIYSLSYGVSAKVFICRVSDGQNPILHEGAAMEWIKFDDVKNMKLGFEQEKIIVELEKVL